MGRPRKDAAGITKPDPLELFIPFYNAKELKLIGEMYELMSQSKLNYHEQERVLKGLMKLVERAVEYEW